MQELKAITSVKVNPVGCLKSAAAISTLSHSKELLDTVIIFQKHLSLHILMLAHKRLCIFPRGQLPDPITFFTTLQWVKSCLAL